MMNRSAYERTTPMWKLASAILVVSATIAPPVQAQVDLERLRQRLQTLQSPGSAPAAPLSFRFDDLQMAEGRAGGMARWNVNLRASMAVPGHTYVVQSALLSSSGAVLLTGEDIALPASSSAKTFPLTRDVRLQPGMASLRLEVVDRVRGEVVHAQSYSVSSQARSTLEVGPADRSPSPGAVPHSSPTESGTPSVAVRLLSGGNSFEVRNSGDVSVRLQDVTVYYRFPGLEGHTRSNCARTQLAPGQSTSCTLDEGHMACSALAAMDVEMTLNGQRVQERLPFESSLAEIRHSPSVVLDKPRSTGRADIHVRATGQYLRPGTRAVVKGLITLNNLQRFPASFLLTQGADALEGRESVASPVENQPVDRVCFHVQEIVTEDSLTCGGVGALLYRNTDRGQIPLDPYTGNIFVINQVCR